MSTAGLAAVSRSAAFEEALGRADLSFRHWLQKKHFASFTTWAYMWDETDEYELANAIRVALHQLGATGSLESWVVSGTTLTLAARGALFGVLAAGTSVSAAGMLNACTRGSTGRGKYLRGVSCGPIGVVFPCPRCT